MSSDLDILLIRPRQSRVLSWVATIRCEPLELEQLAAVAEAENCSWDIYDPMVDRRSLHRVLEAKQPRLIAVTGYYPNRPAMLSLANLARKLCPSAILLAGGVDVELDRLGYTDSAFDVLLYQGGAITFRAILSQWHAAADVKGVAGTMWREQGGGWQSRDADVSVCELTRLPPPDRSHLVQHQSRFLYLDHGPVSLLKSAYGCPYDCRFCCCKLLNGKMYTPRPVEDVAAELSSLPTDTVWIVDDTFLVNVARIRELAAIIREQRIRKRLIIYARAGEVVQAAKTGDLSVLKDMGVVEVIVGLEAVQADKLESYGKQVSVDENMQCVSVLREAGIRCIGLFMVEPDSDVDEFTRLRSWIRENQLEVFSVSIFSPFPGTEDYSSYETKICCDNPRHWDLRHLVMRPTHMSTFMFYMRYYWLSAGVLRNWRFVLRVARNYYRGICG